MGSWRIHLVFPIGRFRPRLKIYAAVIIVWNVIGGFATMPHSPSARKISVALKDISDWDLRLVWTMGLRNDDD